MNRLRSLFLALAVAAACSSGPTGPGGDPNGTFRVLFVGNSLTYVNDLPRMVAALADSAGVEATYVETVAFPNYALEDHWARGDALRAIRRGGWRYVVMQQGPSSLPESRANLIEWAGRFAAEIRAAGAIPALYTVWPDASRIAFLPDVIESYRLAAEAAQGVVLPAGAAWQAAWRRNGAFPLYGGDGFHPSAAGTYLAAITIVGRLFDRPATGLPRGLDVGGARLQLSPADAALLQAAADEANGR